MRLAAIDVGSNSLHMVIADVSADGHIEVVDRVKEMVRLGRSAFTTGHLTPEAMNLATSTLTTFGRLARARHVERLRIVATSAVREARNGAAFVRRLRRQTGLPVRVISGAEEARLIYRAARYALGLDGGPYLLVDVGGGSVELVLVQDGRALWLRSLPLGAARLSERFLLHDPPRPAEVRQLEKHLRREMGDVHAARAWYERSALRGQSRRWWRWRAPYEASRSSGCTALSCRQGTSPVCAGVCWRSEPCGARIFPAWTPSASI